MKCPEELKALYMSELEQRRKEDNFLTLAPTKGKVIELDNYFKLVETETADKLLTAWYDFHKRAKHNSYRNFYSKIFYSRELANLSIDSDFFLELIADREFLFLEYGELYTNWDYPPLSSLVKSPKAEKNNYGQEKYEAVLEQAFVPTEANSEDYWIWQENLTELKTAEERRIQQMKELSKIPESFTIQIKPSFDHRTADIEEYLSELFDDYVTICSKRGFQKSIEKTWDTKPPWIAAIHSLMKHLEKHPTETPGISALCFFHLFSQQTKKLSEGTLSRYTFSQPRAPKRATGEPRNSQGTTRVKTQINILLYDQLLELFIKAEFPNDDVHGEKLKKYREDAKFIFYHFTRYDRYYHYNLDKFWYSNKPAIHFNYDENYRDGVDYFGNLLRFHISQCMPNYAQWLEPVLDPSHDTRNPPLTILTTFLLAEASSGVPAKSRIANRVYGIVKSDSNKDMLKEYESCYGNTEARRLKLASWVTKYGLTITREDTIFFEGKIQNPVIQNCGKYVLEYFLRDRMIQASREVLYQKAKSLFDGLCFDGFSYSDFAL